MIKDEVLISGAPCYWFSDSKHVAVNKTYLLTYKRSSNYLLLLNGVKKNEIKKMSIRVLRFMIGFIALIKFSDIYAVEYGLEADNLPKLEISDSGQQELILKMKKLMIFLCTLKMQLKL
ncbi:conjugative transfer protein [Orientia tsutsugamushi]|uniref:Conjugative transfer protein n=1 Tax=Orientia tsutsugamushi TaxID=784 RepID=A0A2U3QSW2_ORITS|nr:hypothetical protein OTSUT76_1097 [Orientia tsutsugamushi str. UT76]SPR04032.1 conjugative transfer protein [Orientia tsutsugamushi]